MSEYTYTTQAQIRAAFWEQNPTLPRKRIRHYSGKGLMYPTDTRVAFVDFIDYLSKGDMISQKLANRATLEVYRKEKKRG